MKLNVTAEKTVAIRCFQLAPTDLVFKMRLVIFTNVTSKRTATISEPPHHRVLTRAKDVT